LPDTSKTTGIYALRRGVGRTPVVFLHGWASSSRYWLPCIEALPGSLDCTYWLLDLPGFGRSTPLPDITDLPRVTAALGEAVVAFLDEQQLSSVTLVGHSTGGNVAMHAAARSTRISGLVLEDSTSEPPGGPSREDRIAALRRGGLTRQIMEQGMRGWYRRLTAEQAEDLHAEAQLADLNTLIATQYAIQHPVPDEVIDRLRIPVQLIHGSEDPQRDIGSAERFGRRLPDAKLAVIDQAGHTPHYDAPEAFADILSRFLITHM